MKARHIALCLTLSLLGAGLQAQDDLPQGWVCETWFYDGRGNTVQHVKSYPAGTAVKEQCGYDFAGNLTERVRAGTRDGNALATETLHYTYDRWGRALATTHRLDDSDNLTLVSNTYDAVGRLASTSRGGTSAQSAPAALSSSYAYNVRGWLTGIVGSLFSETLAYETPRPGSLDGEWGGNISSATWKTAAAPSDSTWYDYGYDRLGRLVEADYGNSASSAGNRGQSYWYDLNGNMTGSQSPGRHTEFAAGDRMALLSWTFSEGNAPVRQLREYYKATTVWSQPHPWQSPRPVIVMEPETLGRVEEYFTYDAAGNRTATRNVQGDTLALMRYNLLNLPEEYVTAAGDTVRYVYSADGEKLHVQHITAASDTTGTEYAANFRIENDTLTMIHTDAGYYTPVTPPGGTGGPSYMHVWYLKDHLGNNRVLADGSGNALKVYHYDPFGEQIFVASPPTFPSSSPSFPDGATESPYRYGGKEWSVPTSTYDFEARQFSPSFHRFTSMDPLAEKYYSISPYAYCADDPVNLVDPQGEAWYTIDVNGNIALFDERNGKEEEYDMLFRQMDDGSPNMKGALKVNDRSILSSLWSSSETSVLSCYHDLLAVFYYVADNTNVEWGLYSSLQGSVLKTEHSIGEVSAPSSFVSSIIAKIHSHPETAANTKAEYDSMGFWLPNSNFTSDGEIIPQEHYSPDAAGDWARYRLNHKASNGSPARTRIYFPQSGIVYQLHYNQRPSIVERRK